MITSFPRAARRLMPLALAMALVGCATGKPQSGDTRTPEQSRLDAAPAAERELLAAAQAEAAAAQTRLQPAKRLVDRRALEVRLADAELDSARAFSKAARVRAELVQKFGAESGFESAPVLTLLEQADAALKQAEVRAKLAMGRYDQAESMIPVTQAQIEVARRKVDVAKQRALAATRPGVESVAYPPLADAQARQAGAEAELARAQALATRRLAAVESAEFQLGRLGAPVTLITGPGAAAWPAPTANALGGAHATPAAPVPPAAPALTSPATPRAVNPSGTAAAPPPVETQPAGGAVTFEPAGGSGKPR